MNVSEFIDKEYIGATDLATNQIEIAVNRDMPDRSIFVYLEINSPSLASPTGWILKGNVTAYNNGVPVGNFPCSIGELTGLTTNESLISLFNGGGYPVGDSLFMQLAAPFTNGNTTAVIQPFHQVANIDKLVLNYRLVAGFNAAIVGIRSYLACRSTP